jgi:predicted ester cyclase
MSTKDPKVLTHHLVNEFNKGRAAIMAVIDEIFATNIVLHSADGRDIRGLKDHKQMFGEMFDAFPDGHMTLDDMLAEGDNVAIRYTTTGTHNGEYMGILPTHKTVTISMIEIDHIVGGKFVEAWARTDTMSVKQQPASYPHRERENNLNRSYSCFSVLFFSLRI